ncbi:leucine-rich repeat domain-containing protein [Flavicella sediminum]|uniref:leucine-rich repeat domain-containing protein n=1 Tax=Flavicella sediminum TaxID=2585141 RepID=UPI00111E56AE|nr:hypothetical protein [Flavicella sediminum]
MNTLKITSLSLVITSFFVLGCTDDHCDCENEIYVHIPDSHFETMLIEQGIDSDGIVNQKIAKSEAIEVTHLDLNLSANYGKVVDLTGISGFENLSHLSVYGQKIKQLDLSGNTLLDTLYFSNNYITSLDLSKNTNLVFVDMQSNSLTSVTGLENAMGLKDLDLSWNYFEEFSVNNPTLEVLHMRNNDLKELDISGAINLKHILLTSNLLPTLDVSSNTKIETLLIADNKLEHINFEFNSQLTHLYIFDNVLESLDLSANDNLTNLIADRNPDLTCIKIASGQEIPVLTLSDYQELNEFCN